ncbi:MAG: N-6 DNA methylase [Deltaproteobacteria bacterium]|nr:N-6 DNA methylase [Deltaproteobacteria bacterium]
MLDTDTKRRIDTARDILVGKVPDPKSQVEQITIALIYKFMDDMDAEAEELGGKRKFFAGDYARYGWAKLMRSGLGGHETLNLYAEAIAKMPENPGIPALFRDIFKNAYLPYRDPETLRAFLKIIDEFTYDHSERLGDAFEYLLSVLGSQGDAGQFRTPRHIIDFIVAIVDPKKTETVLDPACGTAGFLISAYKFILRANTSGAAACPTPSPPTPLPGGEGSHFRGGYDFAGLKKRARELRQKQTDAETLLWGLLRDRQLGDAKFRRQHQFGDYICDFYCHEAKLVVECDGDVHQTAERRQLDAKRDTYLKSQGLNVLRFRNNQILQDPEPILEAIAQHLLPPSPVGRGAGGEGVGRPGDLLTPDERGRLAQNIRGYDISPDMVRLSLVNLYLHGFADPHIAEYDTLTSQDRWNEYADVILANPPFMSPKGGIKPHNRFSVQSKRSEVLFVDYMAEHLTTKGRAGIIVPEGIIFQSQTAYTQLRKMLVEEYLVAVVSLPAGVFNPYSGVKTSVLLLDKSLAKQAQTIAFFKIENDGFGLGAQRREIDKNELPQARAEIAEYLRRLRGRESVEDFQPTLGLVVPKEKIAANGDYNLSGERYREGIVRATRYPIVPLGEVAEVVAGQSPPGESYNDVGTGTPFYQGKIEFGDMFIGPPTAWTTEPQRFAEAGDILMSVRAPVGPVNLASQRMCIGRGLAAIRPAEGRLLAPYAFYFLRSQEARINGDAGAVFASINRGDIEKLQIPLPPLEVQKEIVAEIEGYQKVIDGARAVLDHYRPHIPIHPDWPMVRLGEVVSYSSGGTPSKANEAYWIGEIPWVSAKDMKSDVLTGASTHVSETAVKESATQVAPVGSLLILVRGMGLANGVPICELATPCAFNQDVKAMKPNESVNPTFLRLMLKQEEPQFRRILETAAHGTLKINTDDLSSITFALPSLATQQAIVAEIEAEQALVAANRELITRFEKKIQATLARVWGEDEPAPAEA